MIKFSKKKTPGAATRENFLLETTIEINGSERDF